MNLGDPELELIDPTPNIFTMFVHFDKLFFSTTLASRAVVRWSKRMYSCAGICSYEGRGGLCDIAVSEPLLKLRPRKDLVETLLHEMIHAYLFVTRRDQDRDGHGPNFQMHMHRINNAAGLNISIYHDFHDEVKLYQTHWWRCNGSCQKKRPYFGIVRRPMNKAPGPSDFWWKDHQRSCGGTFTKIKEPENMKKKTKPKLKGDITKYIINNNNNETNNNLPSQKPVLKPSNAISDKSGTKSNSSSTLVVSKKGIVTFNPKPVTNNPIKIFSGQGKRISGDLNSNQTVDVKETVRNVWASKNLPGTVANGDKKVTKSNSGKTLKHKPTSPIASPPMKIKKIDDYFKTNASIVLKDLYGRDFKITESTTSSKLIAIPSPSVVLVDCPICRNKINDQEINRHLDECLNMEEIEKLSKVSDYVDNTRSNVHSKNPLPNDEVQIKVETVDLSIIDNFQVKSVTGMIDLTNIDRTNFNNHCHTNKDTKEIKHNPETFSADGFDKDDIEKVKAIAKKIKFDKNVERKQNNVKTKQETHANADFGYLPSSLDENATAITIPPVKIEPGPSKDIVSEMDDKKCPCCGNKIEKPIEQHLDECLAFFDDSTMPEEGASTSYSNNSIFIDDDDDDIFDETQTMNATGTKAPCPCCLDMVEEADMNKHLDLCLS